MYELGLGDLDAQNLEILVEADCDPVRLRGAPLDLVDLALGGRVGQDGILDGARHLLDVPDQRLVVVTCRTKLLFGGNLNGRSPLPLDVGQWLCLAVNKILKLSEILALCCFCSLLTLTYSCTQYLLAAMELK